MPVAPTTLTLKQAASKLDVHYMTVYRYVRIGRLPATRQGAEWRVLASDVAKLSRDANRSESRRAGAKKPKADPKGLERRLLAGDSAGAWWLIESGLAQNLDPTGVMVEMIVPAMQSIGARWAAGELSVADEHRATAVAQRLVGRLGLQFGRPGKSRGTVVLAAPAGDLHILPVAITADLLRWRGFEVAELGANTPAESVADAAELSDRLVSVGIVSTTTGYDAEVAAAIRAVHARIPDVTVMVGGSAIRDEEHTRGLGADVFTGSGPMAVVDSVERMVPPSRANRRRHVA